MSSCNNTLYNLNTDSATQGLNHLSSARSLDDSASGSRSQNLNNPNLSNPLYLQQTQFSQTKNSTPCKHTFPASRSKSLCIQSHPKNMALSILQWNMKGLLNNFDELCILIKDQKLSIILLQETHCPFYFTPIIPKGYVDYWSRKTSLIKSDPSTQIF